MAIDLARLREDAIEALYVVFARYPVPRRLWASPDRDAAGILRALTAAPLRALPAEALGGYPAWAMTTVGRVDDYRHFLPRILELAIRGLDDNFGDSPEQIAGKLQYGQWQDWPADERAALERGFLAGWATCLEPGGDWRGGEWVCALAMLGWDLDPAFALCAAAPASHAAPLLAGLVLRWKDVLLGRAREPGVYWESVDDPTIERIKTWLRSSAVAAILDGEAERIGRDAWQVPTVEAAGLLACLD